MTRKKEWLCRVCGLGGELVLPCDCAVHLDCIVDELLQERPSACKKCRRRFEFRWTAEAVFARAKTECGMVVQHRGRGRPAYIQAQTNGPKNEERYLFAASLLALSMKLEADYAAMVGLCKEAYDTRLRESGIDHPTTLAAADNLCEAYRCSGDIYEMQELMRATTDRRRRILRSHDRHHLRRDGGPEDNYALFSLHLGSAHEDTHTAYGKVIAARHAEEQHDTTFGATTFREALLASRPGSRGKRGSPWRPESPWLPLPGVRSPSRCDGRCSPFPALELRKDMFGETIARRNANGDPIVPKEGRSSSKGEPSSSPDSSRRPLTAALLATPRTAARMSHVEKEDIPSSYKRGSYFGLIKPPTLDAAKNGDPASSPDSSRRPAASPASSRTPSKATPASGRPDSRSAGRVTHPNPRMYSREPATTTAAREPTPRTAALNRGRTREVDWSPDRNPDRDLEIQREAQAAGLIGT
jgi:hypothetical protein